MNPFLWKILVFIYFSQVAAIIEWTWISGNSTINIGGVYGNQGVPSPKNYPGARYTSAGGIDSSGSFWIFGGQGYDTQFSFGKY